MNFLDILITFPLLILLVLLLTLVYIFLFLVSIIRFLLVLGHFLGDPSVNHFCDVGYPHSSFIRKVRGQDRRI